MKTKLFTLFLALVANALSLWAQQSVQIDGIWYDLFEDGSYFYAEIRSCQNSSNSVVIPPSVTYNNVTYSITGILAPGFTGNTDLTFIELPNTIIYISNDGFKDCINLASINLPNSLTVIGPEAFYNCSSLTSITIPKSVTFIAWDAFDGCTSLTSITWNAVDCSEFGESPDHLFGMSRSQITSFTFGNEVQNIPNQLCEGMNRLTSIIIPNSVTSIGEYAFAFCSRLTSVTIPNSVTSIGEYAFLSSNITSIIIPDNVTEIKNNTFEDCENLLSLTIGKNVTSIGENAFDGCTSLTSITWNAVNYPNSDPDLFGYYPSIIPHSITSFTFGSEVRNIPSGLCTGRRTITSITIPNSVTSIGGGAFKDCSGLTSIEIPNSVTSIGERAFEGCTGLFSIDVPNSVTSIGDKAFGAVPNINYTGSASGAPWGARCLNGYVDGFLLYSDNTKQTLLACSTIATGEIVIPNSVTSIGNYAFLDCSSLTSVIIPNSVTSIGSGAFSGCSSLTSVINYVSTWQDDFSPWAFYGIPSNSILYVLDSSLDAYRNSGVWRDDFSQILPISALNEDNVPDVVQTIPSVTTANITWPQISGAASYDLVIRDQSGNAICTLVFDNQGVLQSISFAALGRRNMPEQAQVAGFTFTVTGLEPNTTYTYSITAKNNNGAILDTKQGSFTTNEITDVETLEIDSPANVKFFHNGHLLIQRGDQLYNAQGARVR